MDELKGLAAFVRTEFLALAFLGALIALSFWPPLNRRGAAIAVGAGTVVGCVSAPIPIGLIEWLWPEFPLTLQVQGAFSFWLGLLGMKIVPKAAELLDRFKLPEGSK